MAYTGGELNELNGKMGISAPYKSVPVMKLIKNHNPKSKAELVSLIETHFKTQCNCGVISKGTVEQFGKNLYEAQLNYWGGYKYSLDQCIQWEYDLFITQSLKGGYMEKKAQTELSKNFPKLSFKLIDGMLDEEYRIDIVAYQNSSEIFGVQVKPHSYNYMRESVQSFNKNANQKWHKPVYYLFYDENLSFVNLNEIINPI